MTTFLESDEELVREQAHEHEPVGERGDRSEHGPDGNAFVVRNERPEERFVFVSGLGGGARV